MTLIELDEALTEALINALSLVEFEALYGGADRCDAVVQLLEICNQRGLDKLERFCLSRSGQVRDQRFPHEEASTSLTGEIGAP